MNTWRVRKLPPWEYAPGAARHSETWVVERVVWGRWQVVVQTSSQRTAFVFADGQARR